MHTGTDNDIRNTTFINKAKVSSGVLLEIAKNRSLYMMLLPGTLFLIVFSYLPMAGIIIGFKDFRYYGNIFQSISQSDWVGLKNFQFLFSTPNAYIITRNTVLYNMAFIFLGLVASVFIAIVVNEMKNRVVSRFYHATYFLPYFFSWVVVGYVIYSLLNMQYGLLNTRLLPLLGIEPVSWYTEPKYWPIILTLINLWKNTGYNSIIYLAAITAINGEYFEAAELDGATRWQQIKMITIPMIKPQMIILSILAVGRIFSADFGLFYNVPLGSGTLFPTTSVIDTYVYTVLRSGEYGMATAAGLYQALVGFVLVLITNAVVRKLNPDYSLF